MNHHGFFFAIENANIHTFSFCIVLMYLLLAVIVSKQTCVKEYKWGVSITMNELNGGKSLCITEDEHICSGNESRPTNKPAIGECEAKQTFLVNGECQRRKVSTNEYKKRQKEVECECDKTVARRRSRKQRRKGKAPNKSSSSIQPPMSNKKVRTGITALSVMMTSSSPSSDTVQHQYGKRDPSSNINPIRHERRAKARRVIQNCERTWSKFWNPQISAAMINYRNDGDSKKGLSQQRLQAWMSLLRDRPMDAETVSRDGMNEWLSSVLQVSNVEVPLMDDDDDDDSIDTLSNCDDKAHL